MTKAIVRKPVAKSKALSKLKPQMFENKATHMAWRNGQLEVQRMRQTAKVTPTGVQLEQATSFTKIKQEGKKKIKETYTRVECEKISNEEAVARLHGKKVPQLPHY